MAPYCSATLQLSGLGQVGLQGENIHMLSISLKPLYFVFVLCIMYDKNWACVCFYIVNSKTDAFLFFLTPAPFLYIPSIWFIIHFHLVFPICQILTHPSSSSVSHLYKKISPSLCLTKRMFRWHFLGVASPHLQYSGTEWLLAFLYITLCSLHNC